MADIVELRLGEIDAELASAWDALAAARESQADIYDSHVWFAAWLHAAPAVVTNQIRIPTVVQNDRPVALLPLVFGSARHAAVAGMDIRTRARPIIGTPEPLPGVLDALAEAVARTGVRELALHRLPARDPATHGFIAALRGVGYRVDARDRSCDNIARADGGWAEYARRLKGFAGYAKRFTGRLTSLWDVRLDEYGTSPERPVSHGFALYEGLQRRSWKGQFSPAIRSQREELLSRAEARGWARVFVLALDDVPAAAHVWFRLGDVATWLSTAYDRRLAALSPGTVIMWQAQERLFASAPPHLIDLLPGANPQKERLTVEKPPLLLTEAVRPATWTGVTLPVRRQARRVRTAAAARVQARRRLAVTSPSDHGFLVNGVATPTGGRVPVRRLGLNAAVRRYLATAAGQPSPEATAAAWADEDTWWSVGDEPRGLVRLSGLEDQPTVHEIVRFGPDVDPLDLAAQTAAAFGGPVVLRDAAVRDPALPWPRAWQVVQGVVAHAG